MALGSILSELTTGLRRNFSMTVSLVVTMSVSLVLASLGLLLQTQADRTEKYYGDRLQIQVNLCTQNSSADTCVGGRATPEQEKTVETALDDNPEVRSFERWSPERNYEQAQEYLGQNADGRKQLEALGPESFGTSYMVTLRDPNQFEGVVSQVSGLDGVAGVVSMRDLLAPLFEVLSKLRWAALGTSLLLIVAAVLQVSNTIRMTAYARRREIGIMRLVGASSWHIQLPFILESLVAAVISAALACGGLAAFMQFVVYGFLRDRLAGLTTWVRWQEAIGVMGYTSILALLLALVPTLVMTRRYLKV
ncbi:MULTISPECIES: permease-like cell division protein FtsX [Mumia]|uniref:permease-like cell division protein FtsX n=1 Tax=Mumia TaxID=1546255 RepID=UPI00141FD676|nr:MULTISPECIES: permease-like cell division protein FtsX [unclassified Mumia]QMW65527.1 FtsX-like permease family protein [Mumia sp. ZJ1417]